VDEEPTLKNIGKELITSGYWERAHERKRASRTIWDLIFLPIGFAAIGAYWYAFGRLFLWFHLLLYPTDAARLDAITTGDITPAWALMFLVPLLSSIPLGLLTSNVLTWLVPPARRASERKAEGVKWASLREAQLGLFEIALVLVPIGVISGIVGAFLLGR